MITSGHREKQGDRHKTITCPRPIRSDLQNRLAELVAARRNLMRDRTAPLNRLKTLTTDLLKRHARHRLRQIEAQVASLDAAIEALVAEDPNLSRRRDVLPCGGGGALYARHGGHAFQPGSQARV